MIVVLTTSLFSEADYHIAVELTVLLKNSRHIVVADIDSQEYKEWAVKAEVFAQRLTQMVLASARLIVAGGTQSKIYVHRALSEWGNAAPRISFEDAVSFIPIPFKIFVENRYADRDFLLAFLDKEKRDLLLDLEINNHLHFVHGGGTGELQKQLVTEADNTLRADLRSFSYFDNDGLVPNSPSVKTLKIKEVCESRGIRHHQLIRRSIENYVPTYCLALWASTQSSKRSRHTLRQITPFKKLSQAERDHFNMKAGPHGDGGAIKYTSLNPHELRLLSKGFGKKISSVFGHQSFRTQQHDADFQRSVVEIELLYGKLRKLI